LKPCNGLSDPNYRLLTYDVTVSDGTVYVETGLDGTSTDCPSATEG
jgi:hypothetical protein